MDSCAGASLRNNLEYFKERINRLSILRMELNGFDEKIPSYRKGVAALEEALKEFSAVYRVYAGRGPITW